MGGVHGNNRLGGNSLLDCVVYGRVAGNSCAEYMMGSTLKRTDLKALSGGGISGGGTNKSALSGGSYEDAPGAPKQEAKKPEPGAFVIDEDPPKAPGALGFFGVMACTPVAMLWLPIGTAVSLICGGGSK